MVESQSSAAADPDSAPSTEPAMAAPCVAAADPTAIVVMDKLLTLPQLVDGAGITCSYQDGLLRIVVPMAPPTLDDEHRELIAALEQEHKDAAAQPRSSSSSGNKRKRPSRPTWRCASSRSARTALRYSALHVHACPAHSQMPHGSTELKRYKPQMVSQKFMSESISMSIVRCTLAHTHLKTQKT